MDKKRWGQSVINEHRSLRSNELSQKYRRVQQGRVKHTKSRQNLLVDVDNILHIHESADLPNALELPDEFDIFDYERSYLYFANELFSQDCFYGNRRDIDEFKLNSLIEQLIEPANVNLVPKILEKLGISTSEMEPDACSIPPAVVEHADLEKRLAAYIRNLISISSNDITVRDLLAEVTRNPYDRAPIDKNFEPEQAKLVYLFAPFWIRKPSTWKSSQGHSLLDHLFAFYPVPEFLYDEWNKGIDFRQFRWISWFILFGQGGSLKRFAKLNEWIIPNKFPHYLHDAAAILSPVQACVYAEIRRLGGTDIDFARISQNPAFVIDLTLPNDDRTFTTFWHETVIWMVRHRTDLTDEESEQILEWAMHQYTESRRQGASRFSLKKLGVRSVLERTSDYFQQFKQRWYGYSWSEHGWNWQVETDDKSRWSFVELTKDEELFCEGKAMRHCVRLYAHRCVSGRSAIVSMRHNGARWATVEISPASRRIVQARGRFNRELHEEEQRVLDLWHKQIVMATLSSD